MGDLETRLGRYCSYCERRFPGGLAVEHVIAKSLDPSLRTAWENFLLGCSNCNSVKAAKPTNHEDFLWPDVDNTFRAFCYSNGGLVDVAANLDTPVKAKAKNLMNLVGLDRHPGKAGKKKSTPRDRRAQDREEIWALARLQKQRLAQADTDSTRDMIVDVAKGYGCFSVWMSVFKEDAGMRKRLLAAFTGTALDSFDKASLPINRPGGRL